MAARVTVDMGNAIRKTKRRMETVVQEFTQDLAETAVDRTPLVTGFLKGSWFPSLDGRTVPFTPSEDKSGARTVARMAMVINQARIGDVIFILNGAEYARHVEFGTSRMAPRAFVRSTVADAPQILKQTIRRIAK